MENIVYKITNLINNKCYIGISRYSFHKRYNYKKDWWNARSINKHLKYSVKKYGSDNFIVEILEKNVAKDLLEEKEKYWIKYYNSFGKNGYNLTSGGSYNYEISKESKKKNSETNKKAFKNGRVHWNKGKNISKEQKKKQSLKMLGRTPWNKNIKQGPMTEEARKNSAIAHYKKVIQMSLNGDFIKEYESLVDTKKYGFNPAGVCRCCKNSNFTHRGFKWKYC